MEDIKKIENDFKRWADKTRQIGQEPKYKGNDIIFRKLGEEYKELVEADNPNDRYLELQDVLNVVQISFGVLDKQPDYEFMFNKLTRKDQIYKDKNPLKPNMMGNIILEEGK